MEKKKSKLQEDIQWVLSTSMYDFFKDSDMLTMREKDILYLFLVDEKTPQEIGGQYNPFIWKSKADYT